MRNRRLALKIVIPLLGLLIFASCHLPISAPIASVTRSDDEIIVAGKHFHTGTRVITWLNPAGYDGYKNTGSFTRRRAAQNSGQTSERQAAGMDLPQLQKIVDQFVLHYDGHGLSKTCFEVLCERGLSVHFLLDLDGTVYQILDLQERAAHATTSNDRSIGVEIANIGAFPPGETREIDNWYRHGPLGQVYIEIPDRIAEPKIYTKPFVGRPARPEIIHGTVQEIELVQYDLTAEQYTALIKLSATLCRLFPQIKCDYPRDAAGQVVTHKLPDDELAAFKGILGHFHIQTNKIDPGPALQWDKLVDGARQSLR